MGYAWAIPDDEPKPKDARIKRGKYIKQQKDTTEPCRLFERNTEVENSLKRFFDITDLRNKIAERQAIINNHIGFGVLDRGNAIRKITDLRKTDGTVGVVYVAQVTAAPSMPLDNCPDHQLIDVIVYPSVFVAERIFFLPRKCASCFLGMDMI